MFVPVNCTNCGKPFQVPEAALGKPAPCPWCQAVVTALPVSAPVSAPVAHARPTKPQAASPEPLSLDDAPTLATATVAAPPTKRYWKLAVLVALVSVILITATILTVGELRRKDGHIVSSEWRTFTPPDGSCKIDLLGTPVEDPDAPASGQRRYLSEGWYSGTRTWLGWKDLSPAEVQMASGPNAWQLLRTPVLNPEKARLKAAFEGYEAEGGGTKSFEPLVVEFRLQTTHGLLIERVVVKATGSHPRAYFIGMVGKRVTPDAPELERLFSSFRVNE